MSNQNNNPQTGAMDLYKSAVHTIFIPLLIASCGAMFAWMGKIEERQYILQREAVTEQKLGATEQRIMSYMDVRIKDLDNKMNLVIRQLEYMNTDRRQNQQ